MSQRMTTIEKLAAKHFKVFGDSPDYSFWDWLAAVGVNPNEEELKALLNGTDYWDEANYPDR